LDDLDLWIGAIDNRRDVAALPCEVSLANGGDVLLRHRPRSIS
jgi:hypothetical protein